MMCFLIVSIITVSLFEYERNWPALSVFLGKNCNQFINLVCQPLVLVGAYISLKLGCFRSKIGQTWKKFKSFRGHVLLTIEIFTNRYLKIIRIIVKIISIRLHINKCLIFVEKFL